MGGQERSRLKNTAKRLEQGMIDGSFEVGGLGQGDRLG